MPDIRTIARLAVCGSALVAGGCSGRTFVAVDPYPCSDGGATSCPPGLTDDLIGYWRLDDAPGSTTAHDWSGWANDGTLVDLDPSTSWVTGGPEGGALSPQGIGYVDVAHSTSIDSISAAVTVAAWIFINGPIATYATAISRQIGTSFDQHYHLSINAKQQAIIFITTPMGGQVVIGSPMTVPQQTWVHIAGTYDGRQVRLYVNGTDVADAPASGPFAAETNPVILSGNGNGSDNAVSEFVPGQLDEIMLYRRALGADEIARLAGGALLPSTGTRSDGGP